MASTTSIRPILITRTGRSTRGKTCSRLREGLHHRPNGPAAPLSPNRVFADSEAVASAKTAASQNQSEVFLLSCITKNNTFASGYYFHIEKDKNFDPNDTRKKSFVDIVDHDFIIDALAVTANDCTYVNLPSDNIRGTALDSVFKTVSALEADALDFSNNALLKTSLWATKTAGAKIYPAINRNPALDPSNPPAPGDLYWTAESNVASGLDVTAGGLVNSASSLLGCGRRP